MHSISLLAAAEEELRAAAEYYSGEDPGLGEDFLLDVERALDRIVAFPTHGRPYLLGTRRILLHRFPLQLIYRVRQEELLVIAIAHQRRRPGYWVDRA